MQSRIPESSRLELNWNSTGTQLELNWNSTGTQLELNWNSTGTLMATFNYSTEEVRQKRFICGIFAIFFGMFGIHKFILGYTGAGAIMLIGSLLVLPALIMAVIGLIEGIIYLTKTDDEFREVYLTNRKEWF
jgi:TM2 domain-containing membrane protein YozV